MQHPIDPKIDCVFKALLGSDENRNLLIHFLNAFLAQELNEPLVWVEILNPYNDNEFLSDKLSIVGVKAKDSHEQLYQIEIQLTRYGHLPARIIYNWADIYSQQLKSGQGYGQLRPTYSIWLLAENLLSDDSQYVHPRKTGDRPRLLTP
jgi:predicted transposase/invertase (TIGR01784 family)